MGTTPSSKNKKPVQQATSGPEEERNNYAPIYQLRIGSDSAYRLNYN
jgi:hypothetical protein